MKKLSLKQRIPKLPKGIVSPQIITGLLALGRGHDKDKIISFLKSNKYIMSLRPKWVHEKIEEYTYVERTTAKEDLSYDFNSKENFTSNNHKRSIISKLEELE